MHAAYKQGFQDYFNMGYDTVDNPTWGGDFARLFSTQGGRTDDLIKNIQDNPQQMYEQGSSGLGGNKGMNANIFLMAEALNNGAKPTDFEALRNKYADDAFVVHGKPLTEKGWGGDARTNNKYKKSDITGIQGNENQVGTLLYFLQKGAGFTADDLAARVGDPAELGALLYAVRDTSNGNVRLPFNEQGVPNPKETEVYIMPDKMRTQENMNALMRHMIAQKVVSAQTVSLIKTGISQGRPFKLSEDVLCQLISGKYTCHEDVGNTVDEKKQVAEEIIGTKENGYNFSTWEITPKVVETVISSLDDETKKAFITYARENNIGQNNPELIEALNKIDNQAVPRPVVPLFIPENTPSNAYYPSLEGIRKEGSNPNEYNMTDFYDAQRSR